MLHPSAQLQSSVRPAAMYFMAPLKSLFKQRIG